MFKNPGKRIKTLARFNFWFLLIGSIIAGIILLCTDYVPIGLPLLLGGPCIAYVENLLLFGFGELVENSAINQPSQNDTNNNPVQTSSNRDNTTKQSNTNSTDQTSVDHRVPPTKKSAEQITNKNPFVTTTCPECGTMQNANNKKCYLCGKEL